MTNIINKLDSDFDKMDIYKHFLAKTHEENGQLCKLILDKFSESYKKYNRIVNIHMKTGQKNCRMSLKFNQLKKRVKRLYLSLKNSGKLAKLDPDYKKLQKELEIERRRCYKAITKNGCTFKLHILILLQGIVKKLKKRPLNWGNFRSIKNASFFISYASYRTYS